MRRRRNVVGRDRGCRTRSAGLWFDIESNHLTLAEAISRDTCVVKGSRCPFRMVPGTAMHGVARGTADGKVVPRARLNFTYNSLETLPCYC
jgi:hypothetical protein